MSGIEQYFLHIPLHRVIVCLSCKYCIRPTATYKHLCTWHKDLTRGARKELEDYCSELDLAEPHDVTNPVDKVMIPSLKLYDGNKCTMDGCNYMCSKDSMAVAHARGHGWVTGRPKTWVKTHVQVHCFSSIDIDILCRTE
jgi:Orsellinic acid/F9775 biosynthesis cluster protein D